MTSRSDVSVPSDREQSQAQAQRDRDRRPTSPSSYLHFRSHSRTGSTSGSYVTSSGLPVSKSGSQTQISAPNYHHHHHQQQHQLLSSSISTNNTSEATPTPSASALRRALAANNGNGNTSDSGSTVSAASGSGIGIGTAGSKFSSLLHTLQPSSRMGLGSSHGRDRDREGSLANLPPRSNSRAESAMGVSPAPSPMVGHSKIMPSNASIRVPYGGSGQYSSATLIPPAPNHPPPSLPTAGSSSTPPTTHNASGGSLPLSAADKDNPWGALHVHVLPLFNRDPLRFPIEDLNSLVRRHMLAVISRNPNKNKAVEKLEGDVQELIMGGMVTLNSKLAGGGVDEDKLVGRIVELWGFFWDQVLPYVEGIFLPLQIDPYLLMRAPKSTRAPSPSHSEFSTSGTLLSSVTASSLSVSTTGSSTVGGSTSGYVASGSAGGPTIDVRKIALRAFRDSVVLPVAPLLQKKFSSLNREKDSDMVEYQKARLEQMLLVLSSISTHTVSINSNTLKTQPSTPGEKAVTTLLRLVLHPPGSHAPTAPSGPRLPSFLSGGGPRDRRGRVARKSWAMGAKGSKVDGSRMEGRYDGALGVIDGDDREREGRELLNSLKSPNPDFGDAETNDPPMLGEADDSDGDEDGGGGTVMPHDGMEPLGTGPGGWGPGGDGDTGNDVVANGRRVAVYEDPDLQNPMGAFEEEVYTSPGRGGRRPDTGTDSERRSRV